MTMAAMSARVRAVLARGPEAGSGSVETAIMVPALFLLIFLMIGFGRVAGATSTVDNIAFAAARAASLERSSGAAQAAANAAVNATIAQRGLHCDNHSLSVNTGDLGKPAGAPGTISASFSCTVPLGDLTVPGMPGSKTLTSSAVSAIDTYRTSR